MKKLIIIAAIVGLLVPAPAASAHVLVTDQAGTQGAILHIIPDDDPVAGQTARLYFETQDGLLEGKASQVELTVTNSAGQVTPIKTAIDKTLVTANYTFPAQGVYQLNYSLKIGDKNYQFNHSQRVSRGVSGNLDTQPVYLWAEMLMLLAGIGLALLGLTAFNRRRDIAKQSQF